MARRDRSAIFAKPSCRGDVDGRHVRSGLARETALTGPTIGQILKGDMPRMPNAQLAADCAAALGVSADWLLGLTNRPERPVISSLRPWRSARRSEARPMPSCWPGIRRRSATRCVTSLPRSPICSRPRHCCAGNMPRPRMNCRNIRLEVMAGALRMAAIGRFRLRDRGAAARIARPAQVATVTIAVSILKSADPAELHCRSLRGNVSPAQAVFYFDARQVFSAPVTVFGTGLAVIYVGQCYLALREPSVSGR